MAKRTALLMLWFVAAVVTVDVCWCWGEEAVDNGRDRVNAAAENVKQGAAETVQDTKDTADSWSDWAIGKFSQ